MAVHCSFRKVNSMEKVTAKLLRGQKIADLVTTGAAIDFVIPDIDR